MNKDKLISLNEASAAIREYAQQAGNQTSDPQLATVVRIIGELFVGALESLPEAKA